MEDILAGKTVMRDFGLSPERYNYSSRPSAREKLSFPQTGKELWGKRENQRFALSVAA